MPSYVQRFTDRLGKMRTYFRHGDLLIRLPNDLDSPEFNAAYVNALAEYHRTTPAPERRRRIERRRVVRARPDAIPNGPAEGVYLLSLKGEIVYVGTSHKMPERVRDHRSNGREFDKVFYIEAEASDRIALETQLIRKLRPPKNRAGFRYVSRDHEAPDDPR